MVVTEIMKTDVATCSPADDVASAARIMHEHNCGFLPVIDTHGNVAGVITDRDVCLFAADRRRAMTHISVSDVMSHPALGCFADENVKTALTTMSKHRVRRLPVLDRHGRLQGVLSTDDVVEACDQQGAPSAEEIVGALKGIYHHPVIEAAVGSRRTFRNL